MYGSGSMWMLMKPPEYPNASPRGFGNRSWPSAQETVTGMSVQ